MKYIIGVVGENGAGKDTFTTFFKAAAAPLSVSRLRFSDILAKTLRLWGIEITRPNLQALAITMDKEFGKGSLTRATKAKIHEDGSDVIIIEGVRWKTDVPMIRSFRNSFLVYVTAKPRVRFERMKTRGEKAGERGLTSAQFQKEELAATEVEISHIGKRADFVIENNGTLDEFRLKTETVVSKIVK